MAIVVPPLPAGDELPRQHAGVKGRRAREGAPERLDFPPGRRVPEAGRPVAADRQESLTVRHEADVADACLVARQGTQWGARLAVLVRQLRDQENPRWTLGRLGTSAPWLFPGQSPARPAVDILFGVRLHTFDAAVERALRDLEALEDVAAR